jgi:pSer/pThr/pTyr-binding forkhead associated (FHA) protein
MQGTKGNTRVKASVGYTLNLRMFNHHPVTAREGDIIGRGATADITVNVPFASRRHCRLDYMEGQEGTGGWHVVDLCSLNGTFVNDVPVPVLMPGLPVKAGDTITVGAIPFTVE